MKKLFTLLTAVSITLASTAQDADQKFQMGIATSAGMNFNKVGSKTLNRDGAGSDLMIGMNLQWNITPTISLLTGLEFEFQKFKYTYNDTMFYNYDGDSKIYTKDEASSLNDAALFQVTNRKQKPVLLYIPTMLTFRTSEIGPLRYFGRFGLRSGFVLKSTTTDEGQLWSQGVAGVNGGNPTKEALTNSKMISAKDLFVFRSSIGIAGGAMWNFSGSTTLVGEIGYYYGLTPIHSGKALFGKDDEKNLSLFSKNNSSNPFNNGNTRTYYQPKATQGQLVLKVSILF